MNYSTLLLVFLSLLLAGSLSFFHYYYKAKTSLKVNFVLAFLRFITIFAILLLLINPIITRKSYETTKTPLALVVDNSSSINDLKANESLLKSYKEIVQNKDIQEKFDVQSFQFDSEFQSSSKFDFKGKQTNIDAVGKNLKNLYKNTSFPTIMITDGNQTLGNDYVFNFDAKNKVFPIIVGDTTAVLDLKINQVNANKYAFLKNKFPVEVFLNYSGTKNITANFSISQGKSVLNTQKIAFSPSKKTAIITVLLPAEKVGFQLFEATIKSDLIEKNTYNNVKKFAVEIIDQKTNVAIISDINHPDIGMLKRSIESNAQRKVAIVKVKDFKTLQDFNVLILYQPNAEFKRVFDANAIAKLNTFIITGTNTDFNFLNLQQSNLNFKMSGQKEDYSAEFNSQFNEFAIDDIGFKNFPPLQNLYGTVTSNGLVSNLLSSKIRNLATNAPLLAFFENQGKRSSFLLGENIWKWRLQSHIDQLSYQKFDIFIDKIIQYLASNNSKKSLIVNHQNFYNSGDGIEIDAQYFNKNYELDENARLTISVINNKTKKVKNYDLLKSNTSFKVNLDGLAAGNYNFSVKELNSNSVYSSHFEILDFDIERQFVNPDVVKLSQLATQTQGKVYYPDQVNTLIKSLLANNDYKAVQKEVLLKSPLIDWVWLLALIAISLTAEWFIRKYNGML